MQTDNKSWNVTEIIDLAYGADILRLRRDGTIRVVVNGEETIVRPVLGGLGVSHVETVRSMPIGGVL